MGYTRYVCKIIIKKNDKETVFMKGILNERKRQSKRMFGSLLCHIQQIYWRCNFETFLLEIIVWMQEALESELLASGDFLFFLPTHREKIAHTQQHKKEFIQTHTYSEPGSISAFREMFKYSRN